MEKVRTLSSIPFFTLCPAQGATITTIKHTLLFFYKPYKLVL